MWLHGGICQSNSHSPSLFDANESNASFASATFDSVSACSAVRSSSVFSALRRKLGFFRLLGALLKVRAVITAATHTHGHTYVHARLACRQWEASARHAKLVADQTDALSMLHIRDIHL
eukprot:GHVU01133370.1.p1 GENE.GHVU01133370.1~~GHVU01133370.1.p1  ORF type:complete len:119 (+),score=1.31 GHVU01133370.1:660-1016(+)